MQDTVDFGEYDVIIAGGGTAGCLLANRLSADPARKVLMLEAGPRDKWIWIHIPVGYLYCIGNPRTDWCYKTEPEAGLNGRSILYARGRVLGGCTSINGMIYMRGQAEDYDGWAESTGDARWNWQNVLPLFRDTENHWAGATPLHGGKGEWRVEKQRLHWEILERVVDAAQQAGIAATDDFNRGTNEGVGFFEVNQKRGMRWSATKAFLNPIEHRPNLRVVTDALIDRLDIAEGRVRGVHFLLNGKKHLARARSEVVLTAGAIGSPAILHRSGIGPAAWLQQLGVEVVQDRPAIGANLQDHLQIRAAYKVKNIETLNRQSNSLWGQAKMALEYAINRSGPLTMAPSQLGIFARSSPEVTRPDIEFHVQPLSLDKFGDKLHPFDAFTASVCDLRPQSRGEVKIREADPRAAPIIAPNYLSHAGDRKRAAAALRLVRRVVEQPALAPYEPTEFRPGPSYQTDEDLARAAGDIGTTIFHPVGTCRMGRADDPASVTDSEMRFLGLAGLRIADASVMPALTSGNTASPTLMIAERAAALMRGNQA
jgi:choline dehydrogenase